MTTTTTEAPLQARMAPRILSESPEVPAQIMWMPAGTHTIVATRDGQPITKQVTVTAETARVMDRALREEIATGHRPLIDFNHKHQEAAGWPTGYSWKEGQGVMMALDWSDAGRAAIQGRTYRAFSPEFFASASGQVTGSTKFHGGLVNDPAFEAISPIWAQRAHNQNNTPSMDTNAPAVTATATTGAAPAGVAPTDSQAALQAARSENSALQARLATAEASVAAARSARTNAAIQAAVARGALPAADAALQERWRKVLNEDESNAELLASLPAHPAVQASSALVRQGVQIQARDGVVENLRAFQASNSDSARAVIFAREISPVLNRGERLGPILAANNLGSLSGDLVARRSLALLKESFPVLSAISTDYSDQAIASGQTVKTRLRSIPTTVDYVPGTGYAVSDAIATDVPILIDQHKGVQISFNANELSSTARDLFGEQADAAHYALGKVLVDAIYAKIIAANFANTTTKALANFARADMTAMAKALFNRNVAPMGRFALLNPDYYEKLMGDSALVNLAAYQKPEVITAYTLPPVAGFNVIQSVSLPGTGNLTGFAGSADALAIATRLPNNYSDVLPGTAGAGSVSTVTNPDTGLSVMLVQYVDHKLGSAFWRIALQYGVAVGNAASGQRLISAAP
jgi:hypothetical protein